MVTGTPINNRLTDLYALLKVMGLHKAMTKNKEEMKLLLGMFLLRRTKKSVGIKLPPIKEHRIQVDWETPQERDMAEDIHATMHFAAVNKENVNQIISWMSRHPLPALTRARQMCIYPQLLHKAVDEDEHMRELNHPSVSPMERVGVKFLSNMSRASYFQAQAANSREKQFDDEMGDVGLGKRLPSQAELDFAALDQTLTLSGIGQSSKSGALQGLQDYKNHNREKSQKVIDWCTWRCAIAGAIAATLCAIGDWLQVTLFQGDAVVSCEDNQRKTHHNICPACLDGDPDGDGVQHTIPGMQGVCANVANATSYSDIEHQCCAIVP